MNKDFATTNGMLVQDWLSDLWVKEKELFTMKTQTRIPEHKYWDASVTYRPNNGDWFFKLEAKKPLMMINM
ncbi:MAG: hypothetical protein CM15mP126_2120 [Gammaproteobacteria bacterium]|nr:MAG: hypothetical protein CM15mP126_2120 [Gammaproteobacteria bacterium]